MNFLLEKQMLKRPFLFAAALFVFSAVAVPAQETEIRVVDEVVAQVGENVITLSRINREKKFAIEAAVEAGKPREAAEQEVRDKEGELIANLINEELLLQKAKELALTNEIEAQVNQQFARIMQQYGMTSLEALYAEMRRTGVEPDEIREVWRKQATRDLVIQRVVHQELYWQSTSSQLKEYFEKHKEKFTKPEMVSLSEIFLSYAGNTEAAVKEKAAKLVADLRGGADFLQMVAQHSDRPHKDEAKGDLGEVAVPQLESNFPKIFAAVKDVREGQYSEPAAIDDTGLIIFRVDKRTPASNESQFDENAIRMAILTERAPEASRKFLADLRKEAYIKINDQYRPLVSPVLFADERSERTSDN